ncbi:hypothetical protein EVAR_45901_1 [Eumeta japonica]|uniref:Uncharacterized protein n=1 Tax=Eumeta variegata TaxID=151549 RepID=A0A4C1XS32_EUMVA|nr:hypothetical protein EVAR_45901_1 [Eumeta japonica]
MILRAAAAGVACNFIAFPQVYVDIGRGLFHHIPLRWTCFARIYSLNKLEDKQPRSAQRIVQVGLPLYREDYKLNGLRHPDRWQPNWN